MNLFATSKLKSILKVGKFSYPKPTTLIYQIVKSVAGSEATVLDFFAGSGTTSQGRQASWRS